MIESSTLADALPAVLLAALAAGNPARRVASVPLAPTGRLAAVAVVAALPLVLLGSTAGAVLDALAISRPTARVAAGLVLMIVGLAEVVRAVTPVAERALGVVAPLAFPVLLRPELALVVLVAGADHGVAGGAAAVAVALVTVPLCALAATEPPLEPPVRTATDPWTGVARFLAALGVLTGAGLLLDGILAL